MSEKSKQIKQAQKAMIKIKREYELEHKVSKPILCSICDKIVSCLRTKGQTSCKLFVEREVESNGIIVDEESSLYTSSEEGAQ